LQVFAGAVKASGGDVSVAAETGVRQPAQPSSGQKSPVAAPQPPPERLAGHNKKPELLLDALAVVPRAVPGWCRRLLAAGRLEEVPVRHRAALQKMPFLVSQRSPKAHLTWLEDPPAAIPRGAGLVPTTSGRRTAGGGAGPASRSAAEDALFG